MLINVIQLIYVSSPTEYCSVEYFYYHVQFGVKLIHINTLRTGEADLRFYITTVQDGCRKSAFLKRACFPCTIHLIMQYIEPVSEWSC